MSRVTTIPVNPHACIFVTAVILLMIIIDECVLIRSPVKSVPIGDPQLLLSHVINEIIV